MVPPRITVTDAARELLADLVREHGELLIHQSGGCCDGSAPMCLPVSDFIIGDRDVRLGIIDVGSPIGVWISGSQFPLWEHTQLILDVVPGRGAGFSLESPRGVRLLTRSRVFTPEELTALAEHPPQIGPNAPARA